MNENYKNDILFKDFDDDMMQIMNDDADIESLKGYNKKHFGDVVEEDLPTADIILSHEVIPIRDLILLKKILSYSLVLHPKKGDSVYRKVNKNLKVVEALLNSYDDSRDNIINDDGELILHRENSYIYTKQFPLGRLYPKYTSINRLSREFRYVLFKNVYHDIDIVNAHPTILLQYARERNINVPVLARLVNNRKELYEEIGDSYKQTPNVNVKRVVLSAINNTRTDYVSPKLNDLGNEMVTIRSSLYDEFYLNGGVMQEAIDARMKDVDTDIELVTLKKKLQSLYCFNEETKNVLLFKKWYESKFGSSQNHSIVPFFDGLFIKTENIYKYDMVQLIAEYNETTCIKFAYKDIESDWEVYGDYAEYKSMKRFIEQFDALNYREMRKLADKHKIDLGYGNKLTKILDNHVDVEEPLRFTVGEVKELSDITESKYNLLLQRFIEDCRSEKDIL